MSNYPYRHKLVRDLAWACFAAPAIEVAELPGAGDARDCQFTLTNERQAWLAGLDRDCAPLEAFMADGNSRRLGLYFERLWQFFLAQDPGVELLAHNLPVRAGGRTLGEFDLLYYCHERQATLHLELAVKFYLGFRDGQGNDRWPGPDARDRLDLKLEHMLHRQSRLSQRPEAGPVLAELGISDVQREVAFRGYLFQPARQPLPAQPGHCPARPFGLWCYRDTLRDTLDTLSPGGARCLEKLEWLAPVAAHSFETDHSALAAQVDQALARRHSPVQLALLDDRGMEWQRLFVAPPSWPG